MENYTPVYDTQEDIYASFVTELTEAAAQIDVDAAGMEGDIIFGGDIVITSYSIHYTKLYDGELTGKTIP